MAVTAGLVVVRRKARMLDSVVALVTWPWAATSSAVCLNPPARELTGRPVLVATIVPLLVMATLPPAPPAPPARAGVEPEPALPWAPLPPKAAAVMPIGAKGPGLL